VSTKSFSAAFYERRSDRDRWRGKRPVTRSGGGRRVNRREFGAIAGSAVAALTLGEACALEREGQGGADGRIAARPAAATRTTAAGELVLGMGSARDAILRLPMKVPDTPMPLLVLLHGAGGAGERILRRLGPAADEAGIAVLAPDSRGPTWDAIRDGLGPDVVFLNRALERVFKTVSVDPARLAVGGFSDGATYALSLGLINGDLFRRVAAWSPGFVVAGTLRGKPRCFVSHGTADEILPIDRCSRRIVPALQQRGHDVTYREFEGGHEVPKAIAAEAMTWLAAK
jgi:phospholipase/carboxylesterase